MPTPEVAFTKAQGSYVSNQAIHSAFHPYFPPTHSWPIDAFRAHILDGHCGSWWPFFPHLKHSFLDAEPSRLLQSQWRRPWSEYWSTPVARNFILGSVKTLAVLPLDNVFGCRVGGKGPSAFARIASTSVRNFKTSGEFGSPRRFPITLKIGLGGLGAEVEGWETSFPF